MGDRKNKPEIRFKEFGEDWQQCDFSQLVDVRSGRDYKHLSEGEIPVYGTGGYMLSVNDALSYKEDAIGIGRKGTIDKPYILKAPFWTVDTLFYSVPKEKCDLNFIYDIFQNINWRQKDESTGVPSLSKIAINDIQVLVPHINEQTKIGTFFKRLDTLINLRQRKHDKLVKVKKSMLEKMFPQEGAAVPEIRFAGFTGAWERRRLGDIKDVRDGTHTSPKYYLDGYPLVTSKNLSDNGLDLSDVSFISEHDFKEINKRSKVDIGDIIFGMIGTIGNPVIVEKNDFTIKNVALIKREGEVINAFLIQLLKSKIFEDYIQKEYSGSTQTFLGLNKIREYVFLVPKIEEQNKIGTFFKHLEKLINLQQQELDKLKNIKKSCLEKMFV